MMLLKVFTFVLSLVVICESAFVDSLFKCGRDDTECLTKLISTAMEHMSDGVPEIDIPPIDPMVLQNIKMSVLGVDITLIDGVLKGLKKCKINKFIPNIDARIAKLNITCNVIVEGTYEVFSESPLIASILGNATLKGNGDGRVKIKQLNIDMDFPFKVVKRGEKIFFAKKGNKIPFTYEIGKVIFNANNLRLGDTESSESIIKLLNEHWKLIVEAFGKDVMKIAMKRVPVIMTNFFDKVSVEHYLIDDLTPYVEK